MLEDPAFSIVIVSNGPGEMTTWVKPVVESLHSRLCIRPLTKRSNISLRLVLVPCPNATGTEHELAEKWEVFEKITPANKFWNVLLNPKLYQLKTRKGIVIFLGGDQFWSVLLSARLRFLHITYAEWVARWPYWNDRIAAMSLKVKNSLPKKLRKRCSVVGDLMADQTYIAKNKNPLPEGQWVALLPGSKKAKLSIGIPFFLELADELSKLIPTCNFLLPVAPTTNIQEFQQFIDIQNNPIASKYQSGIRTINSSNSNNQWKTLTTVEGTKIELIEDHPAHNPLLQCDLALTTVGANTAELGALAIPMIVIIPTQHMSVMQAWDGFIGIIGRLPIFRWCIGVLLSIWRLRSNKYLAWPNITANKMIVPERIGIIYPKEIAKEAYDWLISPDRLKGQREDLRSLRGAPGAVNKMTEEILNLIPKDFF